MTTVQVTRREDGNYALTIKHPHLHLLHEVMWDDLKLRKHVLECADAPTAQRVLNYLAGLTLNMPRKEISASLPSNGVHSVQPSGQGITMAPAEIESAPGGLRFTQYIKHENGHFLDF